MHLNGHDHHDDHHAHHESHDDPHHDAHAAHADRTGVHDKHAGHSVAMFRDRFWITLLLTIPTRGLERR